MATLNSWQKLSRVGIGDFGNGSDGVLSSATIPTLTKDSCSGTATSATLTTTGSTFANGDVLYIHQTRGTGVGQDEINKVVSGGGTTTLTLLVPLKNTYTDSGNSQAQAIKVLQYTDATVLAGTWTGPSWNGNVGGIFPFAVSKTLTVTGNLVLKGSNGVQANYASDCTGGGFYGGRQSYAGEGTTGPVVNQSSANGNAGGGGDAASGGGVGGGYGGHAVAGANGGSTGNGGTTGKGGATSGAADLTNITFGGPGGGGDASGADSGGQGASSGGIFPIFAKNIVVTGSINTNGATGGEGGGSLGMRGGNSTGGSIRLVCDTATLGTELVTSTGGRIAIHHSGTVTGTTSPTFTDVTDTSLGKSAFRGAMI
jgi:hypothetical protein